MSITPGKAIILTGLAALALVACGGEGTTSVDGTSSAGASSSGAGGAGGAGGMHATGGTLGAGGDGGQGGVMEVKDVEQVKFNAGVMLGATIETDHDEDFIYYFEPAEVTVSAGSVICFIPRWDSQNIISGTYPDSDGKFETGEPWHAANYWKFNVAGTYPFWSYTGTYPIAGTVYVQ